MSEVTTKSAYFRGEEILKDIPGDVTAEQVRETLIRTMPELADAKYEVREDGNINFTMQYGEKG